MNRKNLPKDLKEEKVMARGEFDYAISNDGIYCVKWKDKRSVCVLSSLEEPLVVTEIGRKEKDGNTTTVPCPNAIIKYNKNMGFVDMFDQLKSFFEIDRKGKKWWHRIFFLDASVVNAFIIFKIIREQDHDRVIPCVTE